MCIKKKEEQVKLINHDCLPILVLMYIMLYLMLAYLMLFACIIFFFNLFFAIDLGKCIFFRICHGLLTHSLFISSIILHHAQCFLSVDFSNLIFTPFFFNMNGLCAPCRNSTKK